MLGFVLQEWWSCAAGADEAMVRCREKMLMLMLMIVMKMVDIAQ